MEEEKIVENCFIIYLVCDAKINNKQISTHQNSTRYCVGVKLENQNSMSSNQRSTIMYNVTINEMM